MCLNDLGIKNEETLILSQTQNIVYNQPMNFNSNNNMQIQQNDYIQAQNIINQVKNNPNMQ